MIDKEHTAMFRAAVEVAEERTRKRMEELADEVRPGSQRVNLAIPASSVENHIDTSPIAEAISNILDSIRKQPIVTSSVDTTPIAEVISGMLSIMEKQPTPQVNVDMASIALALSNNAQDVSKLISVQNEKIAILSNAITKLLGILASQKPIQFKPQVTAESPSIVALVKEQREFFAKLLECIEEKPKKRQIRITHGDTESVITEE